MNFQSSRIWFQKGPSQLGLQIYNNSHHFLFHWNLKAIYFWHAMGKHEKIKSTIVKKLKEVAHELYLTNFINFTIPWGGSLWYHPIIIYSYINIHVNILKAKSHSHVHFMYKLMTFSCEYKSQKIMIINSHLYIIIVDWCRNLQIPTHNVLNNITSCVNGI